MNLRNYASFSQSVSACVACFNSFLSYPFHSIESESQFQLLFPSSPLFWPICLSFSPPLSPFMVIRIHEVYSHFLLSFFPLSSFLFIFPLYLTRTIPCVLPFQSFSSIFKKPSPRLDLKYRFTRPRPTTLPIYLISRFIRSLELEFSTLCVRSSI